MASIIQTRSARQGRVCQEKPFQCQHCDKSYWQREGLSRHVRTNHVDKNSFTCSKCDKMFKRKDSFHAHKKVCRNKNVTEETRQVFSCSKCDKTFAKRGNLETHERTHTYEIPSSETEQPFTCSECDSLFTTDADLKRHERIHKLDRRLVAPSITFSSIKLISFFTGPRVNRTLSWPTFGSPKNTTPTPTKRLRPGSCLPLPQKLTKFSLTLNR